MEIAYKKKSLAHTTNKYIYLLFGMVYAVNMEFMCEF